MSFQRLQFVFARFPQEVATLGPVGRNLPAPGTWGALSATLVTPFFILPLTTFLRLILVLLVFVLGVFAAQRVEQELSVKDPGMVIIDEVVGQWMTFLPFASLSFRDLVLGFLLFRIFDIFKPWPVNISEQWFSHGWSIMIDDICAAIYAVFCLAVLRCIF